MSQGHPGRQLNVLSAKDAHLGSAGGHSTLPHASTQSSAQHRPSLPGGQYTNTSQQVGVSKYWLV